jgi:acyl-CoA synthetase (AMP-forming)/AMP-acid ligase II
MQGEEARRRANDHGIVRVGGFGYPIADATLAIVNPETSVICPPDVVGEIWVYYSNDIADSRSTRLH